jgi:hypothetical protein
MVQQTKCVDIRKKKSKNKKKQEALEEEFRKQ